MAYFSSAVYYDQLSQEVTKKSSEAEENSDFAPIFEWAEKPILVGRSDWPQVEDQQYLKGCKWSPDGTCLLIVVRSAGMHVIELPLDLYSIRSCDFDRPLTYISPAVSVDESGLIYDFSWYPGMSSANPSTCCWVSSGHLGPIQVWDAFTGKLRCSYKSYNAQDELETALSVSFSMDGQKIFGGYKKEVKVFETHRPGRESTAFPIESTISAIAISQARPGLVAFGSWKNTISLVMEDGLSFINVEKFSGHKGGITNMIFSKDGNRLYSGARKDNELICWDLRQMNKALFSVGRFSNTSQRIFFDVSSCGKWLASGGVDGAAQVWDVSTGDKPSIHHTITLHTDCCNGLSLHPSMPIMATSSGQHHIIDPLMDSTTRKQMKIENSVCMWWTGEGARPKAPEAVATVSLPTVLCK